MTKLDNGCLVFNPDGKLVQKGDGIAVSIHVHLDSSVNQTLLFYDHHFDQPHKPTQEMDRYRTNTGNYNVVIQKQVSIRQPSPYVSKCIIDGANSENLLSHPHTKRNCYDSCLVRRMYSKCGDVLDYLTPYLTPEMKIKRSNEKEEETRMCLYAIWKKHLEWGIPQEGCNCPHPCHEISFKQEPAKFANADNWVFYMRYRERSILTFSEVPLYSLSSILSSLGGNMGLMAGLSVLSIAEILIYAVMTIIKAVREHWH